MPGLTAIAGAVTLPSGGTTTDRVNRICTPEVVVKIIPAATETVVAMLLSKRPEPVACVPGSNLVHVALTERVLTATADILRAGRMRLAKSGLLACGVAVSR